MAKFTRLEVVSKMVETGMVPLFYHSDIEIAKKTLKASYEGGARLLEFTSRGDFAHQIFDELNKYVLTELPDMIMGVGWGGLGGLWGLNGPVVTGICRPQTPPKRTPKKSLGVRTPLLSQNLKGPLHGMYCFWAIWRGWREPPWLSFQTSSSIYSGYENFG